MASMPWLGVAEHGDAGIAGKALGTPLELPRLAVGLDVGDDLLGHLLEIGFAEQALDHGHRHVGAYLHGPHQVFANALARKDLIDLVVEGVAGGRRSWAGSGQKAVRGGAGLSNIRTRP
jgi:hypothetical protein